MTKVPHAFLSEAGGGGAGTNIETLTRPTGAKGETFSRISAPLQNCPNIVSSGRLWMALMYLTAADVVSTLTFTSGSTLLSGASNQWFSLWDLSRNKLGVTNDDTSTAWAANTDKTLTLASPYTVLSSGLYYVGILVVGAVSISGQVALNEKAWGRAPIVTGYSSSGLTNPASAPATAAAIAAYQQLPYATAQ